MIPVKEYSSADELMAEARRLRIKLRRDGWFVADLHEHKDKKGTSDVSLYVRMPVSRGVRIQPIDQHIASVEKQCAELEEHVALFDQAGGVEAEAPKPRTFGRAMMDLCLEHGISRETLIGRNQHKEIVAARHAITRRLAKEFPHLALTTLGRLLNRDHSSILHALGRRGRGKQLHGKCQDSTGERN